MLVHVLLLYTGSIHQFIRCLEPWKTKFSVNFRVIHIFFFCHFFYHLRFFRLFKLNLFFLNTTKIDLCWACAELTHTWTKYCPVLKSNNCKLLMITKENKKKTIYAPDTIRKIIQWNDIVFVKELIQWCQILLIHVL